MNFQKVLIVLEREFFFRVKTKMFWISTLPGPLWICATDWRIYRHPSCGPQGNEEVLAII
jgi:hypothetical protein